MTSISTKFNHWQATKNFTSISTLECHTGGEPLRIITQGFPSLKGDTILAKRRYCQENYDYLRTALMFEPRGHADMYGAIIVDAEREDSHFGAIFIHNEGYSTMCGHAIIALAKCAVEAGVVPQTGKITQVVIDVPCGQIYAQAFADANNIIEKVTFNCVPSFVYTQNQHVQVEGIGQVNFDIAFGGAFYAYVQAQSLSLQLVPEQQTKLIEYGRKIKAAIIEKYSVNHPFEPDLSFLYGVIFIDKKVDEKADKNQINTNVHSRNVCVFADGEVDRSPTGSGVSGRIALHYAKQQVSLQQSITIDSILGSAFNVKAIKTLKYGEFDAVIPQVSGNAFICGKAQWLIDEKDPLKYGFFLR